MSAGDQDLFGTMIKVENKDIFVDLKKNSNGVYLKLSERSGKVKNTVLIPASGIGRLRSILDQVAEISALHAQTSPERKARVTDHPDVLARSVYVSGLSWSTTSAALGAHFQQIGRVEKAVILTRNRRGKTVSLGCGVVEFSTPADAALAVQVLATSDLDGRLIRCREDRSVENSSGDASSGEHGAPVPGGTSGQPSVKVGGRQLDPLKVFITSLPFTSTTADLMAVVALVGDVVAAEILSTRKGRSLGHAVVEFANPAAAQRAIAELHGYLVEGRPIIVRPYYKD